MMNDNISTTAPSPLAHQFEDLSQQREAGELGMWLFLCTEIMFFGGLFLAYLVYRNNDEATFVAASRELDLFWGTVNTIVLLTSSLTVAFATQAAERRQQRKLLMFLSGTIVLGCIFLSIKMMEYHEKYVHGLMPIVGLSFRWEGPSKGHAELFFDLYFLMTGVHAAHMIIGIGILLVLLAKVSCGQLMGDFSAPIHLTGLYWHFVDVIWVFLFPLFYLVGAR